MPRPPRVSSATAHQEGTRRAHRSGSGRHLSATGSVLRVGTSSVPDLAVVTPVVKGIVSTVLGPAETRAGPVTRCSARRAMVLLDNHSVIVTGICVVRDMQLRCIYIPDRVPRF